MKKKFPWMLGLSVVSGVASSFLLRKKKCLNHNDQLAKLQQSFAGEWYFLDKRKNVRHLLKIQSDFTFFIDHEKLIGKLIQLDESQIVFQDKFGYHLIIHCIDSRPAEFYDEADDCTFPLIKK